MGSTQSNWNSYFDINMKKYPLQMFHKLDNTVCNLDGGSSVLRWQQDFQKVTSDKKHL